MSSAVYFAIVFAAGFVFGTIRVTWLVPMVGVRVAELTELPLMLTVVFFAARWINRRFLANRHQPSRLTVGVTALAGAQIPRGGKIVADARRRTPNPMLGHITSWCFSPNLDRWIALGYVHRDHASDGTPVTVAGTEASVRRLPFVE